MIYYVKNNPVLEDHTAWHRSQSWLGRLIATFVWRMGCLRAVVTGGHSPAETLLLK
jgi:hypothetical protein